MVAACLKVEGAMADGYEGVEHVAVLPSEVMVAAVVRLVVGGAEAMDVGDDFVSYVQVEKVRTSSAAFVEVIVDTASVVEEEAVAAAGLVCVSAWKRVYRKRDLLLIA